MDQIFDADDFFFDVDDFFSGYPTFFIPSRSVWSDFTAFIDDDTKGVIIES